MDASALVQYVFHAPPKGGGETKQFIALREKDEFGTTRARELKGIISNAISFFPLKRKSYAIIHSCASDDPICNSLNQIHRYSGINLRLALYPPSKSLPRGARAKDFADHMGPRVDVRMCATREEALRLAQKMRTLHENNVFLPELLRPQTSTSTLGKVDCLCTSSQTVWIQSVDPPTDAFMAEAFRYQNSCKVKFVTKECPETAKKAVWDILVGGIPTKVGAVSEPEHADCVMEPVEFVNPPETEEDDDEEPPAFAAGSLDAWRAMVESGNELDILWLDP